jgi:hypothetical protein
VCKQSDNEKLKAGIKPILHQLDIDPVLCDILKEGLMTYFMGGCVCDNNDA